MSIVAAGAYIDAFSRAADYASRFAALRDFRAFTAVTRWPVQRGGVVGFSGDSGFSEAPHLHYTVRRADSATLLCPTGEPGFSDGGWAVR